MTEAGAYPVTYTSYRDARGKPEQGSVPTEAAATVYVNGQALIRTMCTPTQLEALAVGFLFTEGLIDDLGEVAVVGLCSDGQGVDVWLEHGVEVPELRAITSGCSGGTIFEDAARAQHRVESDLRVTPRQLRGLMEELSHAAVLYRRSGGVHTAALATCDDREERLMCVMEDIGRHNTIDKIAGACLRREWPTRDRVLLTSGRISSEMLKKTARMKVPVVVSQTSPTSLSIQLAREWDITLIGYMRRRSFHVYTGNERVVGST